MKFEAILFDCDGVLVDSEPITNGVLRDMLNEAGWALSADECMRIFIGKTVRSEAARIEAHTGRPLTDAWMADVYVAAAAALQVAPGRCAVVEDTVTGVTAGVAAGATVFAYAPLDDGEALRAAGAAQVFRSMAELPALLGC